MPAARVSVRPEGKKEDRPFLDKSPFLLDFRRLAAGGWSSPPRKLLAAGPTFEFVVLSCLRLRCRLRVHRSARGKGKYFRNTAPASRYRFCFIFAGFRRIQVAQDIDTTLFFLSAYVCRSLPRHKRDVLGRFTIGTGGFHSLIGVGFTRLAVLQFFLVCGQPVALAQQYKRFYFIAVVLSLVQQ